MPFARFLEPKTRKSGHSREILCQEFWILAAQGEASKAQTEALDARKRAETLEEKLKPMDITELQERMMLAVLSGGATAELRNVGKVRLRPEARESDSSAMGLLMKY